MKRIIAGVVTKLETNTEGYGESLRPVGIDVEVSYDFFDTKVNDDGDFKTLTRKTRLTLGLDQRANVHIGDTIELTISRIVLDGEKA